MRPLPRAFRSAVSILASLTTTLSARSSASVSLLSHFSPPRQPVRRNRTADLLGRLQIDDELEFCRLLHGQIGRLGPFQNLVDVSGSAPRQVSNAHAVGHEAPVFHIFYRVIYRREPVLYREVCNLFSLRKDDEALQYKDCVSTPVARGSECGLDIFCS